MPKAGVHREKYGKADKAKKEIMIKLVYADGKSVKDATTFLGLNLNINI